METMTSLLDKAISTPSTMPPVSGWVRAIARLKGASLDRRLAAGQGTATDRLLAARAHLIGERQSRRSLADDWEHVLTRARQRSAPRSPRVPLQTAAVLAAEPDVRELVGMIREPVCFNPRGIARARLLLADGTGPLYNPRRSGELIPALHAAAAPLSPQP